jgi:hypothetical protein
MKETYCKMPHKPLVYSELIYKLNEIIRWLTQVFFCIGGMDGFENEGQLLPFCL